MKTTSSYIRLFVFLTIAAISLLYIFSPEAPIKGFEMGLFWGVLSLLAIIFIAAEICVVALQSVLYRTLSPEAKERYDEQTAIQQANRFKGIKRIYKNLLGSKPIEEEHEIILDHNYDGIKELDNRLPPWWLYGFYATILFGAIYLVRFHVFNDYTQAEEFETKMEVARAEIEEWKKTAKDLVDVNTVTLLTDATDLKAGKSIFEANCVACHKSDGGGGIGPNLTDEYWILGGGIKNVFNTISEGGRTGKGMVPWKTELKPSEMAQVASYLLSFQGTTPAEPKAPEGEIWKDPEAAPEVIQETVEVVADSTATVVTEVIEEDQ